MSVSPEAERHRTVVLVHPNASARPPVGPAAVSRGGRRLAIWAPDTTAFAAVRYLRGLLE